MIGSPFLLFDVPVGLWLWRFVLLSVLVWLIIETRKKWIGYVQMSYVNNLKWSLLYIKLPRDTRRSPLAMEMILNVLWQTGKTGTWRDLFWAGQIRPYHTLEMVSIEGRVYFFFRIYDEWVDFLKSQIYAQYPEAEIYKVEDYTTYVPKFKAGQGDWNLQGFELKFEKDDALMPIKTYVDYGLDKAGKAEERIDPLGNVVEVLSSLGPGEQYWVQFHVRAAAANRAIKDEPFKTQKWEDANRSALANFEKLVKEDIEKRNGGKKFEELYPEAAKKLPYEYMTKQQKDIYDALDRNLMKPSFDVGVRCIYIAKKDVFRGSVHNSMVQVWRVFNAPGMNGFGTNVVTNTPAFDHPWEDVFGESSNARRDNIYNAYIARSYFYGPYDEWPDKKPNNKPRTIMLMTAEELATIFHFPGAEVTAGSLSRVEARKAEPPANLPTF